MKKILIKSKKWISKSWNELCLNFKKQSLSDIIVWVCILIFGIVAIWVIKSNIPIRSRYYFIALLLIILSGRFVNMQPKAFLTIFSVFLAILTFQINNDSLKKQLEQYQLDKRPVLYVELKESHGYIQDGKIPLFGANYVYKNSGSLFASDITSVYLVADDINGKIDYKKWFSDTFGSFPDLKIIPPDSSSRPIIYTPGISEKANYVCVGILVTYTGLKSGKTYWYKGIDVYRIEKDVKGKIVMYVLIDESDKDWDRNSNFVVPKLESPDWNKYNQKS